MVLAFHEPSPASSFGLAALHAGSGKLALRYFAKTSPQAGQTSAPPDAALHLGQLAYVTGRRPSVDHRRRVHVLHVIEVLERVQQLLHAPALVAREHVFGRRLHRDVRKVGLEPRLGQARLRSEEHTSELQSPCNLVCRLLLEKKKNIEILVSPVKKKKEKKTQIKY